MRVIIGVWANKTAPIVGNLITSEDILNTAMVSHSYIACIKYLHYLLVNENFICGVGAP